MRSLFFMNLRMTARRCNETPHELLPSGALRKATVAPRVSSESGGRRTPPSRLRFSCIAALFASSSNRDAICSRHHKLSTSLPDKKWSPSGLPMAVESSVTAKRGWLPNIKAHSCFTASAVAPFVVALFSRACHLVRSLRSSLLLSYRLRVPTDTAPESKH